MGTIGQGQLTHHWRGGYAGTRGGRRVVSGEKRRVGEEGKGKVSEGKEGKVREAGRRMKERESER